MEVYAVTEEMAFPVLHGSCGRRRIYASMQASSVRRHIHVAYFSAEEVESIQVADLLTWVLSEFMRRAKTSR